MPFPVEITTHHAEVPDSVKDDVRERAEHLERYFQRIVRCEVVIEGQNSHGGPYYVRIDLHVPGQTLAVNHKPNRNLDLGIRQAFEAIRRQLDDYVHRLRGDVKSHATT